MVKILVVCSANISRSQSLGHFIREFSHQQGVPAVVRTAGASKKEIHEIHHDQKKFNLNITPSPSVRSLLKDPAFAVSSREPLLTPAKVVNKRLIGWADVIVAADSKVLSLLKRQFPASQRKMRLVTQYAAGSRAPRNAHDVGIKDAFWPANRPNPPEYEPGVIRGSEEAKRRMLEKAKSASKSIVARWKEHLPFATPRQRKKRMQLQRKRK